MSFWSCDGCGATPGITYSCGCKRDALDVDALANEIRRVDGNHSLGAGALAEALMPFIQARAAQAAPPASADARNAALEEAAQVAEHVNTGAELVRVAVARAIRALKSAPDAEDSAKGAGDVTLPPLPKDECLRFGHTSKAMQDYARAAVLADRQQRGGDVDETAEYQAFNDAAFYKADGHAVGRMDGFDAAWWGWKTRAALAAHKPDGGDALRRLVDEKFSSGNAIPVERITITRTEWDAALAATKGGKQ